MAFESILDKKIRSLLTMLGIIIGVGAVLILVSVVQGYNADLTAYYEKQGVNKVNVSILSYDRTNTTDQSAEFMDYVSSQLDDYVTGVTPSYSTISTLQYGSTSSDTAVLYFGNEQWAACNNYTVDTGRDLLTLDVEQRNRVCVIGSYVAETLFGFRDPIGEELMVNGTPLTVVGVFYQKDGGTEESMDDALVVPYTLNRQMLGSDTVTDFTIKVAASTDMTTVINSVTIWLEENVDTNTGEYTVENGNDAMEAVEDETASLQVVLGGVAGIALLVGGIGNAYNRAATLTNSAGTTEKYLCSHGTGDGRYVGIALEGTGYGYTRVTAVEVLDAVSGVEAADFFLRDGRWYVEADGDEYPVSEQVEIYLDDADGWSSGYDALTAVLADGHRLTLYCDGDAQEGAQVRILVAQ